MPVLCPGQSGPLHPG